MNIHYKGYAIYRIYDSGNQYLYAYCHDDYDGAEDAHDLRFGYAMTPTECVNEIDELEENYGT